MENTDLMQWEEFISMFSPVPVEPDEKDKNKYFIGFSSVGVAEQWKKELLRVRTDINVFVDSTGTVEITKLKGA